MVQWLRLRSHCRGPGFDPGQGTKIPHSTAKTQHSQINKYLKYNRTPLVVQWLKIGLPMQESWVQSLVQEDPTCPTAAKPVYPDYWTYGPEPGSHNYRSPLCPRACAPNKRSRSSEKPKYQQESTFDFPELQKKPAQQQRYNTAKNKTIIKKKNTNKILCNHCSCTSRERSSATQKLACVQFQSWPPHSLQMNHCPYFYRKDKEKKDIKP